MTTSEKSEPASGQSIDTLDERLDHRAGVVSEIARFAARVRAGDVGTLPVVAGLLVIAIVFQTMNPLFLSSVNLVNLSLEASTTGIIALGVVCTLLVGGIDLSVGSMSGMSGAIVALLGVQLGVPMWLAIVLALVAGALVGWIFGLAVTRLGMPSFVATLAGLLAILGVQLYLLGPAGSINIPFQSWFVRFAQRAFVPSAVGYALAVAVAAVSVVLGLEKARSRRAVGLSARSVAFVLSRGLVLLIVLEIVVWYLNKSNGLAWMFLLFVALVLTMEYLFNRTSWGRALYAVGGNAEAARRSGINVKRIYMSAFVLCSTFAALGGVLAAARLGSVSQSSGTGDVNLNAIAAAVIGGTSLFGGRGSARSALLGILVIAAISNGLTLLNLTSAIRFMITGLVLGVAVAIDAVARKSRSSHGAA